MFSILCWSSLENEGKQKTNKQQNEIKIFNGGYLGSHNDEERSEMRYAMRIAEIRETLDFRTHSVPRDNFLWHTCFSVPDFNTS
jgi:hypothetical protein